MQEESSAERPEQPSSPSSAEAPAPANSMIAGRSLRERSHGLRTWWLPEEPEFFPTRGRRSYLLAIYTVRRWLVEDRCQHMAAVLTIHTLLSTVPILGVALMLVGLLDEQAGARLMYDLFRQLVPEGERAGELANSTLVLAGNVTVSKLGAWGFLVTLTIAFALFSTLERTFNHIWRVTRRRSVLVKFTMFYTLATLGPLVMLFSLAEPLLSGVSVALGVPLFTSTVALTLICRFLPYTEVGWRGAIVGGIASALLLEVGKVGFGFYAARFALRTYEGVYGSVAILPILVVWSYLSWMVILLGAEVSFVVTRRRTIALLGYMNRYVLDRHHLQRPSGRTAARLLLAICDQSSRRRIGLTASALANRFSIGLDLVAEVLARLEQHGFVVETDRPDELFVPARPLDQIRVGDVMAVFEHDLTVKPRDDELGRLFADLERQQKRLVADITMAELIAARRAKAPGSDSDERGELGYAPPP